MADKFPNKLPLQLTSFIGREREIAEVKRLLATTRLLTLTGAGGCGKTRLALRVAADLLEEFPNGIWFIDLAPLADPALVPQAIGSVLEVRESPDRPLVRSLEEQLRDKNALLILDNCEHVIASCAQLADTLLRACADVHILATSREPLAIEGENEFRVPTLSLPPAQSFQATTLQQYEAVRLFVDRAVMVRSSFALTDANAPAIAQTCARLDGIPLAIELAAARVKALHVEEIVTRLDDRFRLLTSGSRTGLPRHQTLRAMMDWSYDLLSDKERVLLQRLSVFAGGWSLDAAEALCGNDGIQADEVLDLQIELVDKSLVVLDEQNDDSGWTRYRMLETIRQYAYEKLLASGESEKIRNSHLDFYLKLAEEAESKIHSAEQKEWYHRLDLERANIQAAMDWSQTGGDIESGLRITFPLFWYWKIRNYWNEAREQSLRLLKHPSAGNKTLGRARALASAGSFASLQSDVTATKRLLNESMAIARDLGAVGNRVNCHSLAFLAYGLIDEDLVLAESLCEQAITMAQGVEEDWFIVAPLSVVHGFVLGNKGDYAAAHQALDKARTVLDALGDEIMAVEMIAHLGDNLLDAGDYAAARSYFEEGLPRLRAIGEKKYIATALNGLGMIAMVEGKYVQARAYFKEVLGFLREINRLGFIRSALDNLGRIARLEGDYARAAALHEESLMFRKHLANNWNFASSFEAIGALAVVCGQPERAARLLSASEALFKSIGGKMWAFLREEYDRAVAAVRAKLDVEKFQTAWAEGQALTLEQAIAEAEQVKVAAAQSVNAVPAYPAGLTEREIEVLRWLARGLSNQEIADKLVLSRRTVEAHLYAIYSKLDVTTRSAAIRATIESKIV